MTLQNVIVQLRLLFSSIGISYKFICLETLRHVCRVGKKSQNTNRGCADPRQSSIVEHLGQANKANIRVAHNACTHQPLTSARRADQKSVCINTNTFQRLYLQRKQLWGPQISWYQQNHLLFWAPRRKRGERLIPRYRSESQAGSSRDKELVRGGEGQSGSGQKRSKQTRQQRLSKG